ncbi:unnamed protein product [Thlaspi arvense]|uniref:Protein kinase domain-containing protein n=1 Tax=Thlaspi arvense TaxID=13288 RepID=A0AAU9S1E1_THLAR|nr:unnamed protein product [Thlaspi arvense]
MLTFLKPKQYTDIYHLSPSMGNSLKSFRQQPSSTAYEPLISVSEKENLRAFTFTELKKATKKFRPDIIVDVVGNNCFVRTFYKCYIDKNTFSLSRTETGVAVSVLERNSVPYTLQVEDQEIKSRGQIYHPNLVKVLGYCCKDNTSHFLVFEYYKGSLDRHIYGKEEALPWDIAQGLAFIHSIKNFPLDQELRLHNIMLDEEYNAKLFYLDSNEECLEYTQIRRTDDVYNSPESLCFNGNIVETDVFTFGVILLDLLTGSKDTVKNERSKSSGVWTSLLSDDHKIAEIIDPRLGNSYPVNAATQIGTLIRRCTKWDKWKRPSMEQVLDTLNYIAEIKD